MRVARTIDSVLKSMLSGFIFMFVIIAAISVLAVLLAERTAKRMVKPSNALNLNEPLKNTVYEELEPLLAHINQQNKKYAVRSDS